MSDGYRVALVAPSGARFPVSAAYVTFEGSLSCASSTRRTLEVVDPWGLAIIVEREGNPVEIRVLGDECRVTRILPIT